MRRELINFIRFLVLAIVWGAVLSSAQAPVAQAATQDKEPPIRVAFFNPQNANDSFWLPVEQFMRAAANDLNITVETHVAGFNRTKMIEQVRAVVSSANKPDFIVFKNFQGNAPEILRIAEQHGVKSFLFNAGLTNEERAQFGGPREYFKSWIGQMLPGDELAGFTLAQSLIDRAMQLNLTNAEGKIEMIGLGGFPSDSAAIERNKGLERAIEDNPNVVFHQLVAAGWQREMAHQKTYDMFHRYPDISVIWSANDPMALGAIDAALQVGRSPGKDFLTGGVDWSGSALEAINAGALHTSIGGHFMDGGWVMVLLFDYMHGLDFAKIGGSDRVSQMAGLTSTNLDKYLQKFRNRDWDRIDFTKFSKVKNPAIKTYNFNLDRVLDQL